MKVYQSSSKIKKSTITMSGVGKFVEHKSGLSLEPMKLSTVGIIFVIASLVQCMGATGTFILFYRARTEDMIFSLLFLFIGRKNSQNNFFEVIVKHVNF